MKIFLDTHIVLWLYQGELGLFTSSSLEKLDKNELYISPMVLLEIEYLYEINRIKKNAHDIFDYLSKKLALKINNKDYPEIIKFAVKEKWTRDPFDRIITAEARIQKSILITKDEIIRKNYSKAIF